MKGYGLCTGSILGVTHCGAIALQKIILISVHLRYEKWCSLEQIAAQTPILSRNIAKRGTQKKEREPKERKSKAVWKMNKNVWKRKGGAVGQRRGREKNSRPWSRA